MKMFIPPNTHPWATPGELLYIWIWNRKQIKVVLNFLYHNLHNIGYQITQQNKYDIIIVKIQFTQFGIIMLGFSLSSEIERNIYQYMDISLTWELLYYITAWVLAKLFKNFGHTYFLDEHNRSLWKNYGNNSAKILFIDYRPIVCNIYNFLRKSSFKGP